MSELDRFLNSIVVDPGEASWGALADWLMEHGREESGKLVRLRRDLMNDWREPRAGFDRRSAEEEIDALLRAGVTPVTPTERLRVNKTHLDFAFVPPGSFPMGGPGAPPNHPAPRRVELTKGLFIGTTMVTRAQYRGVTRPEVRPRRIVTPDHPVAGATWPQARSFCRRVSEATGRVVRLPTEAEWEYACRAGTDSATGSGGHGPSVTSWWGVHEEGGRTAAERMGAPRHAGARVGVVRGPLLPNRGPRNHGPGRSGCGPNTRHAGERTQSRLRAAERVGTSGGQTERQDLEVLLPRCP